MEIVIGAVLMVVSYFFLMKYAKHLKDEMKELGKFWWLVIIGELFTGASFILVITFFIGIWLIISTLLKMK